MRMEQKTNLVNLFPEYIIPLKKETNPQPYTTFETHVMDY